MKLVYIHGASATADSFNYIREHLNYPDEIVIEYKSDNGFENNLEIMKNKLKKEKDKIFFIAHSLGGIYSLHLANHFPKKTLGAVTISTPYGGSREADYAKYFLPFSRLMRDIGPHSKPVTKTNKLDVIHPWCNIVTTKGDSPWILEPNDGVVTIDSMTHRKDMEFVELEHNHYEIVICADTVKVIQDRLPK